MFQGYLSSFLVLVPNFLVLYHLSFAALHCLPRVDPKRILAHSRYLILAIIPSWLSTHRCTLEIISAVHDNPSPVLTRHVLSIQHCTFHLLCSSVYIEAALSLRSQAKLSFILLATISSDILADDVTSRCVAARRVSSPEG